VINIYDKAGGLYIYLCLYVPKTYNRVKLRVKKHIFTLK
jgi:hypothetical protein